MSVTVRQLAQRSGLGLRLVAGFDGADRVIAWAHSIEIPDPAPWLSGGELVMTTGLNVGDSPQEQFNYVSALVQAGSVALAFDTGTTFSEVPDGIRAAGDDLGFPILAVTARTPFIAITRAVIDELTADQVRVVQRVCDQQRGLASAALRGGLPTLVTSLGRALSTSVVVVDAEERTLAESGAEASRLLSTLLSSLGDAGNRRSRTRQRINRVVADDGGLTLVQSVGVAHDVLGWIAVRLDGPMDSSAQLLVAHAVSLISIELGKPAELVDAERRLRSGVTRALLDMGGSVDPSLLRYFHFGYGDSIHAIVFADVGALVQAEHQVHLALAAEGIRYLMARVERDLVVLLPEAATRSVRRRLHDQVSAQLQKPLRAGVGSYVPLSDAMVSVRQARIAVRAATLGTGSYVESSELGTLSLLLNIISTEDLVTLSDSALGVLVAEDRARPAGKLIDTLGAYLESNGQMEVAAAQLNVHRHTMRNRIRKIAQLLGRDIESAHARADLWMALHARRLLCTRTAEEPVASGSSVDPVTQSAPDT